MYMTTMRRSSGTVSGARITMHAEHTYVNYRVDANYRGHRANEGPGAPPSPFDFHDMPPECDIMWSGAGATHGGQGARGQYRYSGTCGYTWMSGEWDNYAPPPYSNQTYGSTQWPDTFGSGGGYGYKTNYAPFVDRTPKFYSGVGGRGGGIVHISADETIFVENTDTIQAKGQNAAAWDGYTTGGGGSGGSITLQARNVFGRGEVLVWGGHGISNQQSGNGGGGRIAVYVDELIHDEQLSFEARGGVQYGNYGGPGTVFTKVGDFTQLVYDNWNGRNGALTSVYAKTRFANDIPHNISYVRIWGGSRVEVPDFQTIRTYWWWCVSEMRRCG
jgi:hypothetical protein